MAHPYRICLDDMARWAPMLDDRARDLALPPSDWREGVSIGLARRDGQRRCGRLREDGGKAQRLPMARA